MAGQRAKQKLTEEDFNKCVEEGLRLYRKGTASTRIKEALVKNLGMKCNQFNEVKAAIKKRLIEETDVYTEMAREINLDRLNGLLDDAIEQQDGQLALKVIQEINKMQNVYTQKVEITTKEYRLELD